MSSPTSNGSQDGGNGWKVVDHRPPGHMPLKEAIRRALNSDHYTGTRNEAAGKMWCYRLAKQHQDSDIPPVMFEGQLYLHPTLHPAFSGMTHGGPKAETLKTLPAKRRNRALMKLQVLRDFEAWCELADMKRIGATRALEEFVKARANHYHYSDGKKQLHLRLSFTAVFEWRKRLRFGGLDKLAEDGRGKYDREGPSPDAAALYWALRCDPRRFSMRHCWRMVKTRAEVEGWKWFESRSTCSHWDRRTRDERALTLHQRGEARYTAQHKAYIEPDPESFEPGEAWECDDSPMDVWVKMPNGRVIRPVLSAFLDWRSRTLVGYKLVAEGTQDSVLLAFREGAKRFGLPAVVFLDNGKNFSSYTWRGNRPKRTNVPAQRGFEERAAGLFGMLDVDARWVTPYSPNSKARVERWFRTLEEMYLKALPSYCGNCPDNRPEPHEALVKKAVEWDQFVSVLDEAIKTYNARPHSGEGMNGRSPLEVMRLAPRKRVLDDRYEPYLLSIWHRPVKIGRQGVSITYCGTKQAYGAFTPELTAMQGDQVRVSYDPDDLSYVNVFTMDGCFVCRAPHNAQVNKKVPGEGLRANIRERNREKKAIRKAYAIGLNHLRDPLAMTLAAMREESKERTPSNQPPPGGGPTLIPVRPPLVVPDHPPKPLRKAVGAETQNDMQQRMDEFLSRSKDAPRQSIEAQGWAALDKWAESQSDE